MTLRPPRSTAHRDLLHRIHSHAPTRYRVEHDDQHDRYLFCAYDAVLVTVLTDEPVRLHATPPEGEPIRLRLGPDGPDRDDLWLSHVERDVPLPDAPGQASNRCPYLHLFRDAAAAERWRAALPQAIGAQVRVIPFRDAWVLARAQIAALDDGAPPGPACCT